MGNITGYLIDYGNARILNKRRKRSPPELSDPEAPKARLCLDDARSINAYFVSTRMLKVLALASDYRAQGEIVRSSESELRSEDPILADLAEIATKNAKDLQTSIADQIEDLPHRYIDGMLTDYDCHCIPSLCNVDDAHANFPRRHRVGVVRAHLSGQFRLRCAVFPFAGLLMTHSAIGGQACRRL